MSEAVYRLIQSYNSEDKFQFASESWPKPKSGEPKLSEFNILPKVLPKRIDQLLGRLWSSQFIFLESLWEEYLQNLLLELRHKDARIFEPFCDKEFMAGIVRSVLADELQSTDDIKDEAAARFAAGITRLQWSEQWAQLTRLNIGLSKTQETLAWFRGLDIFFEMRNCIVHRQGRVSTLLNQKTDFYQNRGFTEVLISPSHLDHYRWLFIECLILIESKIEKKYKSTK